MIIHHFSHIGSRNSNQDFVEIQSYNDIDFFIVADGIGGYENGDLAAQMAVESIIVYLTNVDEINQDHIQKAINKANLAIRQKQQSLQLKGEESELIYRAIDAEFEALRKNSN